MSSITPRRSTRTHVFTPKMSERKKGLFQAEGRESLTRHRLPPVESDSDCDSCDLGIISALDCSSSDEQTDPQTPKRGGNCKLLFTILGNFLSSALGFCV